MIIYAGTKGYLDKVPIKQVPAWEEQFLRFMHEQQAERSADHACEGEDAPKEDARARAAHEARDRGVPAAVQGVTAYKA